MHRFLRSRSETHPRSHCGLAYVDDIIFDGDTIECSRMRAYHWTLRNQSDYITALINAQWASSQNAGGIESFPYSLFYVYFAQVCLWRVGLGWRG